MKSYTREKFSVLIVLFLGYVGFSLVFPILPPMFINESSNYLPQSMSYEMRNVLLGIVFAMYPLGQFFGCPIFGKLSDKYGRRPVLNLTLLATALMYILTAFAVEFPNITVLFIARFFTGIFEGNITIATAVMADISDTTHDKTKNFGWLMAFASSGWAVGPFIGGRLADPNLCPWFSFATPFWLGSIIIFICFLVVFFIYRETNGHMISDRLTIFGIFHSLWKNGSDPRLKRVFATNFFFFLTIFFYFLYIPVWLIQRYAYGPTGIGNYSAYISIFICLAPLTYTYFSSRMPHKRTIVIACLGLAISFLPLMLIRPEMAIWFSSIPLCYFIALGQSFGALLISDLTHDSTQGEALGLNQSLMVLSEVIVGLTGGYLVSLWLPFPFVLAMGTAVTATLFLIHLKVPNET